MRNASCLAVCFFFGLKHCSSWDSTAQGADVGWCGFQLRGVVVFGVTCVSSITDAVTVISGSNNVSPANYSGTLAIYCLYVCVDVSIWKLLASTSIYRYSLSTLAQTSNFLCISQDIFRRFLAEHEGGYHWERPRHPWERARINNPETQNSMDLELGIQHCHRVVTRAHCACRGSMVRPGL